jgi:ABC-type branched-subunit amino acid transport system permease subunit
MLFAVLIPAIAGAMLAFPTVRVRNLYLTVITIAFGLVFANVLRDWVSVTGEPRASRASRARRFWASA